MVLSLGHLTREGLRCGDFVVVSDGLDFCVIDIILEKEERKIFVMNINT